MATGEELQTRPELGLVGHVDPAMALGRPVLAHAATGPAL